MTVEETQDLAPTMFPFPNRVYSTFLHLFMYSCTLCALGHQYILLTLPPPDDRDSGDGSAVEWCSNRRGKRARSRERQDEHAIPRRYPARSLAPSCSRRLDGDSHHGACDNPLSHSEQLRAL